MTARIPADIDLPDRVLGPLTARQVVILAAAAAALYGLWSLTRTVVAPLLFVGVAIPLASGAVVLAVGRRDGIGLDRLLLSAITHHLSSRRRVAGPVRPAPAWLAAATRSQGRVVASPVRLPAHAVTDTGGEFGVVDLGGDGHAVIAVAGAVNFALRTPAEQEALVGVFGRYLHSLSAPVQVLVRTHRLDMSEPIAELRATAAELPHPSLEAAALEHADYLTHLARHTDPLGRQVLLVFRQPHTAPSARHGRAGDPAVAAGLTRRLREAAELLSPAGITLTPLDTARATTVLTAACHPGDPLAGAPGLAGPDDIITTPHGGEFDGGEFGEDGGGFGADPTMGSFRRRYRPTDTDDSDETGYVGDGRPW